MPAKRAKKADGTLPRRPIETVERHAPPDVRDQADGASVTDETTLAGSAERVDTGMGAFGEGKFSGGAPGTRGYGQDTRLPGGLGQGSGYAQSSGQGGYGQSAPEQGGSAESGSAQHSDERYSEIDETGKQRGSQYGYGGRGTAQPDPKRKPSRRRPDDAR